MEAEGIDNDFRTWKIERCQNALLLGNLFIVAGMRVAEDQHVGGDRCGRGGLVFAAVAGLLRGLASAAGGRAVARAAIGGWTDGGYPAAQRLGRVVSLDVKHARYRRLRIGSPLQTQQVTPELAKGRFVIGGGSDTDPVRTDRLDLQSRIVQRLDLVEDIVHGFGMHDSQLKRA